MVIDDGNSLKCQKEASFEATKNGFLPIEPYLYFDRTFFTTVKLLWIGAATFYQLAILFCTWEMAQFT
jgi:hypothetical protein